MIWAVTLGWRPLTDVRRWQIIIDGVEVEPPSAAELFKAGGVQFREDHRAALWQAVHALVIEHGEFLSLRRRGESIERAQRVARRARALAKELWDEFRSRPPKHRPVIGALITLAQRAETEAVHVSDTPAMIGALIIIAERAEAKVAQLSARPAAAAGHLGDAWVREFAEAVASEWRKAGGNGPGASRSSDGAWHGGALRLAILLLARVGLPEPRKHAVGAAMQAMRWDDNERL